MSGLNKKEMDKQSEDRYWELEKSNQEHNKKSNRVEQARRNLEALSRLLGFVADDDRLGNKNIVVAAINSNIKVMGEVSSL